jgi:cathepsin L
MRFNKRMQTLIASLLAVIAMIASGSAASQPTEPAQPSPAQQINYAQREASAPPAIRNRLASLRAQIQARNLRFQVGYTTAMDYSLEQLTGLVVPKDFGTRVKEQNIRARQLRSIDDRARDIYIREKRVQLPELNIPATPNSKTFDWRLSGKVTGVRNQSGCGSCWAFAASAAYESSNLIRNGAVSDISEQQVLDCSGWGNCTAGWHDTVFDYLIKTGISSDAKYAPYSAKQGACNPNASPDYRAVAWGYVTDELIPGTNNGRMPTVQELKQALLENGPLSVSVLVTESFSSYTSGVIEPFKKAGETTSVTVTTKENGKTVSKTYVYTYQSDGTLIYVDENGKKSYPINHLVLLVGWDDYQGAWLIKNSWGTGWGDTCGYGSERGYAWIKYNAENIGGGAAWVRAKSNLYTLPKEYYETEKLFRRLPEPDLHINPPQSQPNQRRP